MRWTVSKGSLGTLAGDLLVLPVVEGEKGPELSGVIALAGGHGALAGIIEAAGFGAAASTTLPLHCPGLKCGWVLLVGLGKREAVSLEVLRKAAGAAAQAARGMKARTAIALPTLADTGFDTETVVRCFVEGSEMALSAAGPSDEVKNSGQGPATWTPENRAYLQEYLPR